ncbi:MAG: hypothetical protein QF719_02515 [Chloroflexota bacterium]|nr:hypothetical protein [Chloroflexota bacterium]MDP6508264.1 hypothetical protein [Chloroflexota bacterium]MDP6757077.1 hypothetical protein [Chloroflexota bacterium]
MRRTLLLVLLLAGLLAAMPVAAADDCPFTALDDGCLYTNTGTDTADLTFIQERTYQAVLLLRRISFSRALPWTDLSLYDWFISSIDGIIFKSDFGGAGYCCDPARYMWINPWSYRCRPIFGSAPTSACAAMENYVRALVHEARQVHPEHRRHNCPDGAFDLNVAEGGAYAIEARFIEWMALYGDRSFFTDLDGNTYWEDMLNNVDNVRLWRFCQDDVGYRERGAVTLGVAESGSVGPRTIERWTYAGQAGEGLRIYLSVDELILRLIGPDGALVAESATGDLTFTLPADGTYAIEVHGPPDWTTWYSLELWEP